MRTSETTKNVSAAMFRAIGEIRPVEKDTKGHGYKYATLDAVLAEIEQPLRAAGLFLTQGSNAECTAMITRVTHAETGEWMETVTPLVFTGNERMKGMQAIGASITYARRYAITSLFGISCVEDIDDALERRIVQEQSPAIPAKETNSAALDVVAVLKKIAKVEDIETLREGRTRYKGNTRILQAIAARIEALGGEHE